MLDGTNEIGVISDPLRMLDLARATITTDAAGCQTENTRRIREGEGRYLLTAKGARRRYTT